MSLKNTASLVIRAAALAVAYGASIIVAGALTSLFITVPVSAGAGGTLGGLLVPGLLVACVYGWLARRSTLAGWRLVGALGCVVYVTMTALSLVEALLFLEHVMPATTAWHGLASGAVSAALFAGAAAALFGRRPAPRQGGHPRPQVPLQWSVLLRRLAGIAAAYVVLYFVFGILAMQDPALQTFYAGLRPSPWLPAVQFGRGLAWAMCALVLVRSFAGSRFETALAVGAAFALQAALLLPENAFLPAAVRMTHFGEVATENLVLGMLAGWWLSRRPGAAREADTVYPTPSRTDPA